MSHNGKHVLAVLPIRKGSKRLPNKNMVSLAGLPLYLYTVKAATMSSYIDMMIISTDYDPSCFTNIDNETLVKIVKRPQSLRGDTVTTEAVVQQVIQEHGKEYDVIVLLQVTSPLRSSFDIDQCIELFFMNPQGVFTVSIDSPEKPNGAVYVQSKKNILNGKRFSDMSCRTYCMPVNRSIDIDTWKDFKEAERLIQQGDIIL